MLMTFLLFLSGLTLSAIAAIYAIFGLLAIFPAAPYTIIAMGTAFEVSKLVVASWLYRSWEQIPIFMKMAFSVTLIVLMALTSMSIFGALSKAHMDSSVVTGEAVSALRIIDDKIATHRENINQSRSAIAQMDAQVNELLSRTTDDRGASKAVSIRRQQRSERKLLNKEIQAAQLEIGKLQTERAPLATAVRKVEAEVGPIKYIANLLYGDNVDETLLERAVRIVILAIVSIFDPLAVMLLIAANWQLKHNAHHKTVVTKRHIETVVDTEEVSDVETSSLESEKSSDKDIPPFPTPDELKEKYSDVMENEFVGAISRWTDESLGVNSSTGSIDRAIQGDSVPIDEPEESPKSLVEMSAVFLGGKPKSLIDAFDEIKTEDSIDVAPDETELSFESQLVDSLSTVSPAETVVKQFFAPLHKENIDVEQTKHVLLSDKDSQQERDPYSSSETSLEGRPGKIKDIAIASTIKAEDSLSVRIHNDI